jgi:hypothetical protein
MTRDENFRRVLRASRLASEGVTMESLIEENDRLRAALVEIATPGNTAPTIRRIAKQALAGEKAPQEATPTA